MSIEKIVNKALSTASDEEAAAALRIARRRYAKGERIEAEKSFDNSELISIKKRYSELLRMNGSLLRELKNEERLRKRMIDREVKRVGKIYFNSFMIVITICGSLFIAAAIIATA